MKLKTESAWTGYIVAVVQACRTGILIIFFSLLGKKLIILTSTLNPSWPRIFGALANLQVVAPALQTTRLVHWFINVSSQGSVKTSLGIYSTKQ